MDETQKLAAEQFANIEIIKFMMLDLWSIHILENEQPAVYAILNRERHLNHLQNAIDLLPHSPIRNALLDRAQENWVQIFERIKKEGVVL